LEIRIENFNKNIEGLNFQVTSNQNSIREYMHYKNLSPNLFAI